MVSISESVWEEFHDRLRAFVRRRIDNPADVDDIMQEIFLRVHQRIDTLKNNDRMAAWIYQITRNVIADFYRSPPRRRERASILNDLDHDQEEEVADAADLSALASCLLPMVRQLPETYQEALLLTDFGDLTQQRAAERVGISVSGMKSRVQRGRRKLKSFLLQCCSVEFDHRGAIMDYEVRASDCGCCVGGEPR